MLALVLSSVSAAPDCAYSKGVRHLYNKAQQKRTEKKKLVQKFSGSITYVLQKNDFYWKKSFKSFYLQIKDNNTAK